MRSELAGLNQYIGTFFDKKVMVIGDLMLETFNHGSVSRISPERPIPVFNIGTEESVPGGAANVARNIATLGGRCIILVLVGADKSAELMEELLSLDTTIQAVLIKDETRVTSHKIRYVAQGQHMLRVDNEKNAPISDALEKSWLIRRLLSLVM